MTNMERVRELFLRGDVTEATNSEIGRLTGIRPHQQVFQITDKLVKSGFLDCRRRGRERVFFLASGGAKAQGGGDQVSLFSLTEEQQEIGSGSVDKLLRVGFESVGDWFVEDGVLRYRLSKCGSARKILYAFVADGRVLYIGKSVRSLAERLNGYVNPGPTQSTNVKNHKNIKESLKKGTVEIFAFAPPEDEIVYRGVPLNLAAGLEDGLIAEIEPLWNESGKNRFF